MSEIQKRLQALNITLPQVNRPLGAYVPALRVGDLVYVSGQLPMREGKMVFSGRVGRDLNLEMAQQAAQLCMVNVLASLSSIGIPLEAVQQIIRLAGYVQSAENFFDQPKVLNGASELCHKIFGERGIHTRVALGAYALPLNAAVELEAIIQVA